MQRKKVDLRRVQSAPNHHVVTIIYREKTQEKFAVFLAIFLSLILAHFYLDTRGAVREEETPWSNLAARLVRGLLVRKDFSYAQLSENLLPLGVKESERALASRVSRGRVRLSLLLQIYSVTGANLPTLWGGVLSIPGTWEQRARAVCLMELSRQPMVSFEELAHRMVRLGATFSEGTLVSHLEQGTISLPEFLQCVVALGSSSLDHWIDYQDLVAAARAVPIR
ncbi:MULTISPECIES: DUF6471 domain-containing protein [unclassified Paraburkholderia]|uniref:DUF6471 domain-containing protein n=1 Tax=unclassified Paraburkholderia TaxID=2615204 RepID=UPI002AB2AA4A|nr:MULTISPECIES: DUF6471 domain-containing protein [unclassified Paraburkholderia]